VLGDRMLAAFGDGRGEGLCRRLGHPGYIVGLPGRVIPKGGGSM